MLAWVLEVEVLPKEKDQVITSGMATMAKTYAGENNGKLADPALRQKIASFDINSHAFSLTMKRASEESKSSNSGPSPTCIFNV